MSSTRSQHFLSDEYVVVYSVLFPDTFSDDEKKDLTSSCHLFCNMLLDAFFLTLNYRVLRACKLSLVEDVPEASGKAVKFPTLAGALDFKSSKAACPLCTFLTTRSYSSSLG